LIRRCAIERGFDFLVLRGLVVRIACLRIAPVADVPGVDGQGILLGIFVLRDALFVRNEDQRCWCVGPVGAKVTNAASVLYSTSERAANPAEELITGIPVTAGVMIFLPDGEFPIHDRLDGILPHE